MDIPNWDQMPEPTALLTKSWEDFYPEAQSVTQEKLMRDPTKEEITAIFQKCDFFDCEDGTYWSTVEQTVRTYYENCCSVCKSRECKCEGVTQSGIISDHQTFLDFYQVMGERGATSEILMEADISANDAVIGTADEGTNMEGWNIPPLEVNQKTEEKIVETQGGISTIKEFMAYNAGWEQYKKELEDEN